MWPWRRRSKIVRLHLPHKLFISHSYKDAEARKRLLATLPKDVEPFIFPPIVVPPEQMISDKLLDAIRACDGLINLQGGASAESFWVALERDYALRQGKPVYSFDPVTDTLVRDTSQPLALKVFVSSSHHDRSEVLLILEIMRQRYFDLWFDEWNILPGDKWEEGKCSDLTTGSTVEA